MKTKNDEFILDKRYAAFVAGKVKSQRLYASGANGESTYFNIASWILICVLVLCMFIGWLIWMTLRATPDEFPILVCMYIMMLLPAGGVVSWIVELVKNEWRGTAKNTQQKLQRLQDGVILEGEVTTSSIEENFGKQKIFYSPQIDYRFINPNGLVITGSRMGQSSDSRDSVQESLPKAGTKVYVLYADDDCHMLL